MTQPKIETLTPVTWNVTPGEAPNGASQACIGVLALQGDFLEHSMMLRHLGVEPVEVRLPRDLDTVDALILPGGESTTMVRLFDLHDLREPLQRRVREGMPVWGTCAGMILMAKSLVEDRPEPLGLMDITVTRNAYGRQLESFETDLDIPTLGDPPMHTFFIRAPGFVDMGPDVEVLARLADGTPVAAREGPRVATAFHPELTNDFRFHAYFVEIANQVLAPKK
ncbi:MAG: pyridoxal 5'-phosphate synthase glutaminase subunit PdxT [SAR202 cluster bacterium]|jgi:5'-phosphate synthase pdxT subunit|nr:pyridoxal 5'-phosphate synthase glutaminase subunit PdxT [SAR202 cluster bacterium]|tara:strand:+ start:272 stop:943 length:672 start_codon:yes stop_codon:yes gene_type:complete